MPTLTNLTVNLVGDSTKLVDAANKASSRLQQFNERTKAAAAAAGKARAATAGYTGGLLAGVTSTAQALDQQQKFADQLGITLDRTRRLSLLAEESGVSFETFRRGIRNANKNLLALARGGATTETERVFKSIGLTAKTVGENLEDPISNFAQIAIMISKVEDPAKRMDAIIALLGPRMIELNPLLDNFAEKFADAGLFIEKANVPVREHARGVEKMNDAYGRLNKTFVLFREEMLIRFAPALTQIADTTTSLLQRLAGGKGAGFFKNILGIGSSPFGPFFRGGGGGAQNKELNELEKQTQTLEKVQRILEGQGLRSPEGIKIG